ncbi:tyrosine-type recombinase/integrase [Aeromonas veronii]
MLEKSTITILSYELKKWEYHEQEIYKNDNGEIKKHASGKPQQIGPITLLYYVETDENDKVICSKPIQAANVYLMYQKIKNDAKCVSISSRALKHYFSFLANENVIRRQTNQQELHWDIMPVRENQRPTYRYRQCLKECYHSEDPNIHLARSTCIAYLNRIVDFYKHYLKCLYDFENAPFQHELINISIQNDHTSMQAQRRIQVHTTDLRLKLGKDRRKRPNPLTALAPYQWTALENILLKTRKVLSIRDNNFILTKIPEEFCLIFLLMRWTGMRREEVLTLRTSLLFKPNSVQLNHGYVEIDIGPHVGVNTKFGKERTIEIPSQLMAIVYDYQQSSRYITRREKYQHTIQKDLHNDNYLFLNENGKPYSLNTLNARWSDIRRTLEHSDIGLNEPFKHKAHNLRSTYAVERFINLLNHGVNEGSAFSHVQGYLGHEREATTWNYMRQAQNIRKGKSSPQEIWENVLDFNLEQGIFSPKGDQ